MIKSRQYMIDSGQKEKLINRKELAILVGISERQIQRLEKKGLPKMKIGYNTVRYDYDQVKEWLKGNKNVLQ